MATQDKSELVPGVPFHDALCHAFQVLGFRACVSAVDVFDRIQGHEKTRIRITDGVFYYERWNRYMRRARWDVVKKAKLAHVYIDLTNGQPTGIGCDTWGTWRLV